MPEFTPLQLKLRIKDHHDLGFHLTSNKPVNVQPTPYVPLHPRTFVSWPGGASSTTTTATMASSSSAATDANPAPSAPSLPPISTLASAPIKTILQVLDVLFEPSAELHTLALPALQSKRGPTKPADATAMGTEPENPFSSYSALIHTVGDLMKALAESADPAATRKLHGVLGSHPRLGAKKVDSVQSAAEQAQLIAGAQEEAEKLKALNDEYEVRFPGLRYVVFVNGRSRPVIMEDMRRRIDRGDIKAEEQEAISAMIGIALDRAGKLQAAA